MCVLIRNYAFGWCYLRSTLYDARCPLKITHQLEDRPS